MYDILKLSWDDVLMSDYLFKCNSHKKVVEIKGENMPDSVYNDSDIVIFYNMYTDTPYLLVEKVTDKSDPVDTTAIVVPQEFIVKQIILEEENAAEIICVHESIRNAIDGMSADESDSGGG